MPLNIESGLSPELETLVYAVIGAAIEVHKHLGPGFLENVYEVALCYELELRGIKYERQKAIKVAYKDIVIEGQRLDLIVDSVLILELKAVDAIAPIHEAQLLSYMKTSKIPIGLIINFKVTMLKRGGIKRMVL